MSLLQVYERIEQHRAARRKLTEEPLILPNVQAGGYHGDVVEKVKVRRDPLSHLDPLPADPKGRLWALLSIRAAQNDATETEANIRAVYEDIMDLFREYPREANGWFRAWRTAHPTTRLA